MGMCNCGERDKKKKANEFKHSFHESMIEIENIINRSNNSS